MSIRNAPPHHDHAGLDIDPEPAVVGRQPRTAVLTARARPAELPQARAARRGLDPALLDAALGLGDAPVQARAVPGAEPTTPRVPSGGGGPMAPDTLASMQAAFGADFTGVRVHEDAAAHDAGMHGFTSGNDVVLAPGALAADRDAGHPLLAHELAHVVQQRSGQVGGAGLVDDAGLEAAADGIAARVAAGQPAGIAAGSGAHQASSAVQPKRQEGAAPEAGAQEPAAKTSAAASWTVEGAMEALDRMNLEIPDAIASMEAFAVEMTSRLGGAMQAQINEVEAWINAEQQSMLERFAEEVEQHVTLDGAIYPAAKSAASWIPGVGPLLKLAAPMILIAEHTVKIAEANRHNARVHKSAGGKADQGKRVVGDSTQALADTARAALEGTLDVSFYFGEISGAVQEMERSAAHAHDDLEALRSSGSADGGAPAGGGDTATTQGREIGQAREIVDGFAALVAEAKARMPAFHEAVRAGQAQARAAMQAMKNGYVQFLAGQAGFLGEMVTFQGRLSGAPRPIGEPLRPAVLNVSVSSAGGASVSDVSVVENWRGLQRLGVACGLEIIVSLAYGAKERRPHGKSGAVIIPGGGKMTFFQSKSGERSVDLEEGPAGTGDAGSTLRGYFGDQDAFLAGVLEGSPATAVIDQIWNHLDGGAVPIDNASIQPPSGSGT